MTAFAQAALRNSGRRLLRCLLAALSTAVMVLPAERRTALPPDETETRTARDQGNTYCEFPGAPRTILLQERRRPIHRRASAFLSTISIASSFVGTSRSDAVMTKAELNCWPQRAHQDGHLRCRIASTPSRYERGLRRWRASPRPLAVSTERKLRTAGAQPQSPPRPRQHHGLEVGKEG